MQRSAKTCANAVILAGGLGTRLGKITADIPKPLVPVKGRPFLVHQLELLKKHRIENVLLLTGYRGEQIEQQLGNGQSLGMNLSYNREPEPLGTGGALKLAEAALPQQFVMVYGDSYLDIDYQAAYRAFDNLTVSGPAGLMVVYAQGKGNEDPGNVKLDPTGTRVVSYSKGRGQDHHYIDAGVLILNRAVTEWLPTGQSSLEELVYPRLANEGRLVAFLSPVRFYDIGTPERLSVFERSLN